MPYGLANATCTFQKLMEKVLRGIQWKICLVYLDDVITYSKTVKQHMWNLEQIFDRLRKANLKLHPGKCKFLYKQVKYLGFKISETGTEPSDEKTEVVKAFEPPKTQKQIKHS